MSVSMRPLLLLQVHPSRANSARDLGALETTMQSLALNERLPVSLELAATATSRRFLLRADNQIGLRHLASQIQVRYPQAVLRPASDDPLVLEPGEECSVVELGPGAASYLPLRTWKPRELLEEGADPLLSILAAFSALPPGARAVAQLALLPAPATWSREYRRRAVEHPLAQERLQQQGGGNQAPSGRMILVALLVLGLALTVRLAQALTPHLPVWMVQALSALLHGKAPYLTIGQMVSLYGTGLLILVLVLLGTLTATRLAARFGWGQTPIYDQRLVDAKTARPAYRVRLRVYVIAPGEPRSVGLPTRQMLRTWMYTQRQHAAYIARSLFAQLLHILAASRCLWTYRGAWRYLAQRRGWARLWARARGTSRGVCAQVLRWWHTQRTHGQELLRSTHAILLIWWSEHRAANRRRDSRQQMLDMLTAAYRQYHLASGGYFRPKPLSPRHCAKLLQRPAGGRRFWCTGWAYDLPHSPHVLSVADLAALWHLPQAQDLAELPYVEPEMARTLLAPPAFTRGDGYRLGSSTHAGQTVPVVLPVSCLHQNLLAVASTGKGKSTLFLHLVRAYLHARMQYASGIGGLVLVDFHGDLTQQALGSIPEELQDEVVLIDLANRQFPVGLNPLDMSQGQDRDKVIDNLLAIVEAIWTKSYGSRTENILEYACKTLAEANLALLERDQVKGAAAQYTLLDVVPLLRRTSFRHAIFEQVGDTLLTDWWKQYYELLDARQQAEFSSSTVTKLSKFASTRMSRHILGQPHSTLDLAELVRHERIVLINCASGEVGADAAALLGSFLMGLFQATLAEQARLRPSERHPFLVLIDEFQALSGINYQTMLAELRKYGGTFGLATQSLSYLDRLDHTLRATVMANVDHLFAFAMAADDARLLHLDGVDPEDLINLPNYTCYARLALDGHRFPLFSLQLDAPPPVDDARQRLIARTGQRRYGCPVGDVETMLRAVQTRQETMQPRQRHNTSERYVDAERKAQASGQPVRHTGGRPPSPTHPPRPPKKTRGLTSEQGGTQEHYPIHPPLATALARPVNLSSTPGQGSIVESLEPLPPRAEGNTSTENSEGVVGLEPIQADADHRLLQKHEGEAYG